MLNKINVIPYKVQKGNRPKIEEVISSCLDGDLQKNAMDFVMWMREKKMPFKLNTSTTRNQRADYKGWTLCWILVYYKGDPVADISPETPSFWTITPTLQLMEKYKEIIINEELTSIKWDNINYCTCRDKSHCVKKGVDRTIFNKEYKDLCGWRGLQVRNTDETTIKMIKRLLELDQKARDELN